jgi:uncharacterized membrane protein
MTSNAQKSPPEKRLARFLGWFSLALGVPQTLMPGRFARFIGVRDDRRSRMWIRAVGVRELTAAAGILSRPRPVGWLWARVAGDAKDLVLLGTALGTKGVRRDRLTAAAGMVAGVAAVDALAAVSMRRSEAETEDDTTSVKAAITVWRPREEIYAFWHDFQNLPRFMAHLEAVEPAGENHSHWKAKAPTGGTVDWDAEVVMDLPNELIAWRSLPGADVENSGTVRFQPAPGGAGTEIRLDMEYKPPGGSVGVTLAKLFGEEPRQQVEDDLRRFKQVLEAGEVVRSDGSPEGAMARRQLKQRPAHPLAPSKNGRKS